MSFAAAEPSPSPGAIHNHPSGDPEPSQTDRKLTTTLKDALNMVGTRILDHVVVGYEGCVSLAERGYV